MIKTAQSIHINRSQTSILNRLTKTNNPSYNYPPHYHHQYTTIISLDTFSVKHHTQKRSIIINKAHHLRRRNKHNISQKYTNHKRQLTQKQKSLNL